MITKTLTIDPDQELTRAQAVTMGLVILLQYRPEGELCAEHDEVFFAHGLKKKDVSSQDLALLLRLGWDTDKDSGGWRTNV